MTSRRGIKRRLNELEDDEPTGEPLSLDRVIVACEAGADPAEKYGGYVPPRIVGVLKEMAEEAEETEETDP